jgi:hypothetical protein
MRAELAVELGIYTSRSPCAAAAPAAECIRAIVEPKWKYAVYYDPFSGSPTEYEMY